MAGNWDGWPLEAKSAPAKRQQESRELSPTTTRNRLCQQPCVLGSRRPARKGAAAWLASRLKAYEALDREPS